MRTFIIFLFVLAAGSARSQEFPRDFTGHWDGELQWFQPGKPEPRKIRMQLVLKPTDTVNVYTWHLIYGEKNEDSRPYLLRSVDSAKAHWVIDERNDIILDYFWLGSHFAGTFTVGSGTIFNHFSLNGDELVAEFYSITAKPVNTTGKGTDDIPFVESYAARSYQKAVLKKKKG